MASNDAVTLNGNYKTIFGKIVNLEPKKDWLHKNIEYRKDKKVGAKYQDLIVLGDENAITYAGSDTTEVTFETPTGMLTAPAEITPNTYYCRVRITYPAATRAESEGPQAYIRALTLVLGNGMKSLQKRHSISMIYGRSDEGIGQVAVGAAVSVDSTTFDLVFAEAQWAPGIWRRLKNASLQAYDAGLDLEETGGSSRLTVSKVTHRTRTVRVTATAGLKSQIMTKNASEVLNIFFYGSKTNDMMGFHKIMGNQTASLFAIDADANDEWQGNLFNVGGTRLTGHHIQGYASVLQDRGLEDEDLTLFCSNRTWADLHNELQSARVFDSSYQKSMAEQGFNAIRYFSSSGWIQIVGSSYVKGGDAFMFPLPCLSRIGSKDRSWNLPGAENNPWHDVPDKSSAEITLMTDMGLFCNEPSLCARLYGITNETTVQG